AGVARSPDDVVAAGGDAPHGGVAVGAAAVGAPDDVVAVEGGAPDDVVAGVHRAPHDVVTGHPHRLGHAPDDVGAPGVRGRRHHAAGQAMVAPDDLAAPHRMHRPFV